MVLRRGWMLVVAALVLAACGWVRVREHFVPPPEPDPACAASLLATGNNQQLEQTFDLASDAMVRVVGQGEGASFSLTPGLVESFHNDCVEFFIDLGEFNRQYRFVWGDRKVEGKYADMEGVVFAQGDPSDTDYLFEVAFPWRTLGFKPFPDAVRMDISVCDNVDESRCAAKPSVRTIASSSGTTPRTPVTAATSASSRKSSSSAYSRFPAIMSVHSPNIKSRFVWCVRG